MILLLGGTGQIGWELRRTLAPLGPVFSPARSACDLLDVAGIAELIGKERPRMVVNAAAFTNVGAAELDPLTAFRVNTYAVERLATLLGTMGIPLVHFSTDYVFPGDATAPYVETDARGPLNQYGLSKEAGEVAIQAAGGPHLILRTSWVIGARGSNFLTAVLRRVAQGDVVEVVCDQVGVPTWSRFAAEACAHVCRSALGNEIESNPDPRPVWGTYHLVPTGATSWFDLAEFAVQFLRARGAHLPGTVRPILTSDRNDPVQRPLYSVLSARRLEARFGLEMPPWQRLLELLLDEFLLVQGLSPV